MGPEEAAAGGRWRVMLLLALFAAAMGWMEAVVVEYIRRILGFRTGLDFSRYLLERGVNSLPAFTAYLAENRILFVERTREASTIVMLVCISLLAFRKWRLRLAAFLWAFAFWDIAYYIGLYARIGWPRSLADIDCLFLIPVPWFAPVWFPLVVMACLIAYATVLVRRD